MNNSIFKRCFLEVVKKNIRGYNVRSKYINDVNSEKLPVFEYSVSKSSYNRVFVWGCVATGALGLPYEDSELKVKEYTKLPRRLQLAEKHVVTTIACGLGFTVYGVNSDTDIKLYGTGINTDSQLGYHEVRKDKPLGILYLPQPIHLPIKNPTRTHIKRIAAGRAHLLVLTSEGLFIMGNNAYGQCGRKIITDENYSGSKYIHHIPTIDDKVITDIACGQDHSLALTEDGCVYSCGWGADGQTGLGHFNCKDKFSKVKGDIASEKIVKVASRADFVLAVNDKGEVFGWGNTEYAQIATEDGSQQVCNPTNIKMCNEFGKIKDVGAGGSFCIILNDKGHVYVWGYGILGTGPACQFSKVPIQIPPSLFGFNDFQPHTCVKSVTCGISQLCAITNQGDLYVWGRNKSHCLGLGDEKDQYFPLRVSLGGLVQKVSCGVDHMVALCKPFI